MIKIAITTIISFSLLLLSCKKDEVEPIPDANSTPLEFVSLEASPATITIGGSSTITATCTGDEVTYEWSVNAGELLGSGNQIIFGAPSCCTGGHQIQCIATDKYGNQSTKTVFVQVELAQ